MNIYELVCKKFSELGRDEVRYRLWLVEYLRCGHGVRKALMGMGSLVSEIDDFVECFIAINFRRGI